MLLPFFTWMQNLPLSTAVQSSVWMAAVVNIAHLISLAFFAGAVLIVDLRLLGTGAREQPIAQLAGDARPWQFWGLLALFFTGLPQLASLAIRNYYNFSFWFKMTALLLAVIYMFTIRRSVVFADPASVSPAKAKLVGLVSIVLWMCVVIPARLIGLT